MDPSRAVTSKLEVPCPDGLHYDPYQRAAVEYAIKRKDTLIGDAPGVGKTIEAIATINFEKWAKKILIICPGFLKPNWRDEFLKWDVKHLTVGIMKGMKGELPETDVVIVNYEILKPYRERLRLIEWDFIVVDEAHKLKSKKADRTREIFGGVKRNAEKKIIDRCSAITARKRLFLTGTPSLNGKPKELWNIIQQLDPGGLGSDWFSYATRYCKLQELTSLDPATGRKVRIGCIWDGADNLEELQQKMRFKFMIRRLKEDVLKDLPPKRRMIIPIEVGQKDRKLLDRELEEFDNWIRGRIHNQDEEYFEMPAFGDFSKRMVETGLRMVEPCIEIVRSEQETFDKIVVMCYHNEVSERIREAFPDALLVNGTVPAEKRHALVQRFQNEPSIPQLIGTIGSMGEGETATAASLMIFPERSWVPGAVTQAEDRIHRRGQTKNALYKHLVEQGGLAERQVRKLVKKQDDCDKILDTK